MCFFSPIEKLQKPQKPSSAHASEMFRLAETSKETFQSMYGLLYRLLKKIKACWQVAGIQ